MLKEIKMLHNKITAKMTARAEGEATMIFFDELLCEQRNFFPIVISAMEICTQSSLGGKFMPTSRA
jgi:hypothetical protein